MQAPADALEVTDADSLFDRAQRVIPGGVNSPVRAFRSVGGTPRFVARASGAYLFDTEGRRYIDYIGSWGPMVLGHAHPEVIAAVHEAVDDGLSFGAPTAREIGMAEKITEIVPSMELVRMTSSGTEATMSAIRLARGFTGRDDIVKFAGCYHGHSDGLLVKAGSGALTLGVPDSPGVPADFAKHTLTLPYNDLEAARDLFVRHGDTIAAVIIEPIVGNMNYVAPVEGFLEGLRELCNHYGTVLIFDEVMTGFRVARGGAQEHFGVTPDLTTLGKVIGGGMPVGAFGGRREIMEKIAPLGPVYQAGTLSGNPIAMAAGLKTLELLCEPGFHERLGELTGRLMSGMQNAADRHGIAFTTAHTGGMFGMYFTEAAQVTSYDDVMACDAERFKRFFHAMLDRGVYLAPSAFEAGFTSGAHSNEDVAETVAAADEAFGVLAGG